MKSKVEVGKFAVFGQPPQVSVQTLPELKRTQVWHFSKSCDV